MRGKKVHRRSGGTTHGLPAELEAMKQLGITREGPDTKRWASRRSTAKCPRERCSATPTSGSNYVLTRCQSDRLPGRLRRTTNKTLESRLWRACCGLFKEPARSTGWRNEGYRVLPTAGANENTALEPRAALGRRVYQMRPRPVGGPVTFPARRRRRPSALGLNAGVKALALERRTPVGPLTTNAALGRGGPRSSTPIPRAGSPRRDGMRGARRARRGAVAGESCICSPGRHGSPPTAKDLGYESAAVRSPRVTRHRGWVPSSEGVHYEPSVRLLRRR